MKIKRQVNELEFTVIVPVYNAETYIERCFENVISLKKNNFEFEIIFIDDCSTDNTHKVLNTKSNNHSNITILKTIKNSGPGLARNLGLDIAKGNWILFLDCDDLLDKEALMSLYSFINLNSISSNDIISYNWKYNNKNSFDGRYDFEYLNSTKSHIVRNFLSLKLDCSVIYTLFNKNLLENIRFREGYHEDVDFIFKAYLHCDKVHVFNQVIYLKNSTENSIVNSISKKHIDGFFDAMLEIYDVYVSKTLMII